MVRISRHNRPFSDGPEGARHRGLLSPLSYGYTPTHRTLTLQPGTRLGPYDILGVLGVGGMGEVYRARDPRLQRVIAIKLLPAADDEEERRARFEREAQAIAALNHPNIVTIYSVEQADGQFFLTMELVEGRALADAIPHNGLAPERALPIMIPVVEAVAAAHQKGITHRDLKPANIMLGEGEQAGRIKVLDFGLARLTGSADGRDADTAMPTALATAEGRILGTVAYMSPEQAEGKIVDARSDLFALGVILYELTTGRRPFTGDTGIAIISAIVKDTPTPVTEVNPALPRELGRIVRRALAKDPERRYQTAKDLRNDLEELKTSLASGAVVAGANGSSQLLSHHRARPWPWIVAAVSWVALLALAFVTLPHWQEAGPPVAPALEARVEITTPPTVDRLSLAISPDGTQIVFVANNADGRPQLFLRHLNDDRPAQPIKGTETESPALPFWSPDSKSIGFAASGQLKRIDLDGGAVRRLASAVLFLGGSWNTDGSILFVPNPNSQVFRVADTGDGEPVPVTPALPGAAHHFPTVLPDGRHFLYYQANPDSQETRGVYVAGFDGTAPRRLVDAEAAAIYASGHLLFVQKGALYAQRFDLDKRELSGERSVLVDRIAITEYAGARRVAASASLAGPIAYRTGPDSARFALQWLERRSEHMTELVEPGPLPLLNPALSPNDQRVAIFRGRDIQLFDVQSLLWNMFTSDPYFDFAGVWSPNGSQLAYSSRRTGADDLYLKSDTGAGGEVLLLTTTENKQPTAWSQDEAFLLYRSQHPTRSFDILALSMTDGKSFPVLTTEHDERDAVFSDDGRWFAYQSNESGQFEIYLRPFPSPGSNVNPNDQWQVSRGGGTQPRWSHDGTEIFYVVADGRLMRVPLRFHADRRAPALPAAEQVFPRGTFIAFGQGSALAAYNVSRNGQRFLRSVVSVPPTTSPITVLLNWRPTPDGAGPRGN
jgi:serine/threonine protein kinase/Tol biopolymer transport system component